MDGVDMGAWRTRMRWRLRGALTWPLFVVLTLVESLVLHARPIAGDTIGPVGGFLIAGFLNLLVVAVAAPLLARWLRRRRRAGVPLEIATDRAASALLVTVAVILVALGQAHHAGVVRSQREVATVRGAVSDYVLGQAPALRASLQGLDIDKPGEHFYRACVPDPRASRAPRALCLYVQTDQSPPGVSVDPDHRPNSLVFGPDARDH